MNPTKKVRCTTTQKKKLIEYMSTHSLFANGEFGGPLGAQRHESEWQSLATALREYGPEKTVAAWKVTWRDLKRKARGDNAAFRRAAVTTGNNSEIPPVGESEQMVLSIIGTDSSIGVGPAESSIGDIMIDYDAEVAHPSIPQPAPVSLTNSPPAPEHHHHLSTRPAPSSGPQRRRRPRPVRSTSRFEQLQVEQNEYLKVQNEYLKSIVEELRQSNELRREHNRILLRNQ